MTQIRIQRIDAEIFAPFGNLIDFDREPDFAINNGMCDRYHALAQTEAMGTNAKTIISLGRAKPYSLPLELKMMERHPFGSQAFIPLQPQPFLVVVAPDENGRPGKPLAFMTLPGQGVNYHRNTWHSVLTPLKEAGYFLIVDREGEEENVEEYHFEKPYRLAE